MKIAVVRNRKNEGVIGELGLQSPERYGRRSVQSVMDALRSRGHEVKVLEGDMTLLRCLKRYIPPDPETGQPSGLVFNMSYGIQGEARYSHVPMMLEMAGVPYTGAGPHGHVISLDKVFAKTLMERAGIPTPRFCTLRRPVLGTNGLEYPLVVKPRHESTSNGLELVHDPDQLARVIEEIGATYDQDALVEEYIDGREIAVCLLGNDPVEVLPLVELDFGDRPLRIVTRPDKFHKTIDEPEKICPAPLSIEKTREISAVAFAVYRACHCRDYARVDLRLDRDGTPQVLEINSMATLGRGGGFVMAAGMAGYSFEDLICRIVDVAHERYFGSPAPRGTISKGITPPPADAAEGSE